MNDKLITFLSGVGFGIFLISTFQTFNTESSVNIVGTAKAECEKSLPRDQHCVMVALPVSKD
jgi:hypothetical protein